MPTVICLPLKILRAQQRVSPDDSTRFHQSTPHRKNFRFAFQPNHTYNSCRPASTRSVCAIVTKRQTRCGGRGHDERRTTWRGAGLMLQERLIARRRRPPSWPQVFRRMRQGRPKLRNSGAWSHASGRAAHQRSRLQVANTVLLRASNFSPAGSSGGMRSPNKGT